VIKDIDNNDPNTTIGLDLFGRSQEEDGEDGGSITQISQGFVNARQRIHTPFIYKKR